MASLTELPVQLDTVPCSRCEETFERGYVPATADEDGYTVELDAAICDSCGWTDVGNMGCAPTLSDFETDDLLVRIERDGDSLAPVSITDEPGET